MFPRLLALGCTLGVAAPAAVVLPQEPVDSFKALADRLHATAIDIRAGAPAISDGIARLQIVAGGTGTLLRGGFAVTSLHAVAAPDASGKMTPLPHVEVRVADRDAVQARVLAGAPQLDLALLELPSELGPVDAAELAPASPAEGDRLLAMGVDGDGVAVLGVSVDAVDGDLIVLGTKRMLDSRFWGGPLYDGSGRLAGVVLMSLGVPKAISATVIQQMLDRRPRSPAPLSHLQGD